MSDKVTDKNTDIQYNKGKANGVKRNLNKLVKENYKNGGI